MQVRMLGPLEVSSDRGERALSGQKQRIVLALLALRLGEVVSSGELIEAGWGDDLPSNPANTLQYQIAQLRKIIEDDAGDPERLVTVAPGYRLDPARVTTDISVFRSAVAEGRQAFDSGDHDRAATLLDSALAMWRGPALAEFSYLDFAMGDADRLQSEWIAATELQVDIALATGGHADVTPRLAQLTAEHPLREGLWVRRALALYQGGQQSQSLRVLREAGEALAEIGLEPSFDLTDLERRIFERDESLAPPSRRIQSLTNLPAPPNRLIGRDADVANVSRLLDGSRLVTLLGPGGAGKTRLAMATGSAVLEGFPGGVWFVGLDALDNELLLAAEIGRVSGMRETPDHQVIETLAGHLGREPTLVVLDNCEHLIGAVATLAEELTSRCPLLTILATSQVRLDAAGEVVVTVGPLSLPGQTQSIYDPISDVDAVTMFIERAAEAGSSVEDWDEDSLATIANIVAALDGLPLALELAAARTRSMSLDEIALGLDDRFATLSRGPRTAPDRQRSLLGAVEWSLNLLDDRERALLLQLSVLAGSFDAEDAAAVSGQTLAGARDGLADLVDRSLLARRTDVAGAAHFAMTESLRQYGLASLDPEQLEAARNRHLAHFHQIAAAADRGLRSSDQMVWLRRLDAFYENLRTALSWSLEGGDRSAGVALAAQLGRYWDWRGLLKEASAWTSRLLEAGDEHGDSVPALLAWQSYALWECGQLEGAQALIRRALDAGRALNDPAQVGAALTIQVLVSRSLADFDVARTHGAELLQVADASDDPWLVAWSESALATVEIAAGELGAAEEHARRSLELFGEIGDRRGQTWGLISLAQVALDRGDVDAAEQSARAALSRAVALEDERNVLWALEVLAEAARDSGDSERATRLWGATGPLREARGLDGPVSKSNVKADFGTRLRSELDDEFDRLVEQGRSEADQVVASELSAFRPQP